MLEFTFDNLKKVNRVVVRYEALPEFVPVEGSEKQLIASLLNRVADEHTPVEVLVGDRTVHLSLYIDRRQVAMGAPRQKTRRNGEFTSDPGGLKLTLMFLEQITGQNFKSQGRNENLEEYQRSDIRVVKMKRAVP